MMDPATMEERMSLNSSRNTVNVENGLGRPYNILDDKLNDEERMFLNACEIGGPDTISIIVQCLSKTETLNPNCVDYMGRSALHIAIDNRDLYLIELLIVHMNTININEAVLHAISKREETIVRMIIDHPRYIEIEESSKPGEVDASVRDSENRHFSSYITPLILAAHYNYHEIIQLLLARGHVITRPHDRYCLCDICEDEIKTGPLLREKARLSIYRALASPAYISLTSTDPIMTSFRLRQELRRVASVTEEFKNDYSCLIQQCLQFSCEIIDLCRTTSEVEAVLGKRTTNGATTTGQRLHRLWLAMYYREKRFVAHPHIQQLLSSIYYGNFQFLKTWPLWKKMSATILLTPILPVIFLLYILFPKSKIGHFLKTPVVKLVTRTVSYVVFLFLLGVATFQLRASVYRNDIDSWEANFQHDFRTAQAKLMTYVQYVLLFWILGLVWNECKQVYLSGLTSYFWDFFNVIDTLMIGLYLAAYALRFVVEWRITQAASQFENKLTQAEDALRHNDSDLYISLRDQLFLQSEGTYFLRGSRLWWNSWDPEIVSDCMFALANVLSFSRLTYIMPVVEFLGPLQITLGRMFGDIIRFLMLFLMLMFAFVVGLINLYWYYGIYRIGNEDGEEAFSNSKFAGFSLTFQTLFWSLFGLGDLEAVKIKGRTEDSSTLKYFVSDSTILIEGLGTVLYAVYHTSMIIIIINMLIAMMSHSFEEIQSDTDQEWKFARARLWLVSIEPGYTLPPPFNLIPTPKSLYYTALKLWRNWQSQCCVDQEEEDENDYEEEPSVYEETVHDLVKRYVFKLEQERQNVEIDQVQPSPAPSVPKTVRQTSNSGAATGPKAVTKSQSLLRMSESMEFKQHRGSLVLDTEEGVKITRGASLANIEEGKVHIPQSPEDMASDIESAGPESGSVPEPTKGRPNDFPSQEPRAGTARIVQKVIQSPDGQNVVKSELDWVEYPQAIEPTSDSGNISQAYAADILSRLLQPRLRNRPAQQKEQSKEQSKNETP